MSAHTPAVESSFAAGLAVRDTIRRVPEPNLPWTAERLRRVVNEWFADERVIVLANREPVVHALRRDGSIESTQPASGLVTALEPVVMACGGVWVGHGSGSADRAVVDAADRVHVRRGEHAYHLRRVWLTPDEERGYYYGFANEGLWPLCHMAHVRPMFRVDDLTTYWQVNGRFVDAVCEEAASETPLVLVQDYHYALAPLMIRERLPRANIVTFWHIPWPHPEQFAICPWRRELLEGLLGSSILGFQTQGHCRNFLNTVQRCLEAHVDLERSAVTIGGRRVLVRAYPISVEWPNRFVAATPQPEVCRVQIRNELGLPRDVLMGVGVDRLDYTKGLEEKFESIERLLTHHPELCGRFVFVQVASPSRTGVPAYADLAARVRAAADRVNERFGTADLNPIVLIDRHVPPPDVYRYLKAADVCYVASLHDGMNLVAKEFVTAREDGRGVLVLSTLAGAACELTDALLVNPYDVEEASRALADALVMPAGEQHDRMMHMRSVVASRNAYRWAGHLLSDAARVQSETRRMVRGAATH
jgi:trehalose 6-phosphate synthase